VITDEEVFEGEQSHIELSWRDRLTCRTDGGWDDDASCAGRRRRSNGAKGALPLDRPVGLSATQNEFAQSRIGSLQEQGATDFRVNQQQVDINGTRVGINRPDLQYTFNGQRYVDAYGARRVRDRFTSEMAERYCKSLGLDVFNADAYGPDAVSFESSVTMPRDGAVMTLAEAQQWLEITPGMARDLPG
jgi:hypothetical protein